MIHSILKRSSWFLLAGLLGCAPKVNLPTATTYAFPSPVDTQTKPVTFQEKKKFPFDAMGITLDNQFDGARLSQAMAENDTVIRISILPENTPINPSPWYAFRIRSEESKQVYIRLAYGTYRHRYSPKLSRDLKSWESLDAARLRFNKDSTEVLFPVKLTNRPLYVAAQELVSTRMVQEWCRSMAKQADVDYSVIGKSTGNRPLLILDIAEGDKTNKPLVVVFSRQHPPEVTGYFAMQHFINRLLENDSLATAFRTRYRVLVFPLLNPDGVDNGHWRHNNGGIDLNRDWSYYRQPETKKVADRVVAEAARSRSQVLIGLDFHSTWYDVYYTNVETENLVFPDFKNQWLRYIEAHLPNYKVNERPSRIGQPVSKGWFYTQFKAVGITYEIGDTTPRDFIKQKGIVSAEGMMKILIN